MITTTYDPHNYLEYAASLGEDLTTMTYAERVQFFDDFLKNVENNNG